MEVDNFVQYRRLFYFFQYAFAVRGSLRLQYDPLDSSNLLNVMQRLAQDPEWFHICEEYVPIGPISNSRRNKPNLQPHMPVPMSLGRLNLKQTKRLRKLYGTTPVGTKECGLKLYLATTESQYRNLMLHDGEWLKTKNGRIWKDFINLYRSLLIFDLYQDGETDKSIFKNYDCQYLDEYLEKRKKPAIWIATTCSQALLETLMPFFAKMLENNHETRKFLGDYCKNNNIPFVSGSDEPDCAASYRNRIKQHYKRALQLVRLAETGAFKTFPLVISPVQ